MTSHSREREQLDAAGKQWGTLPALVTLPYLVAYICLALILTGSLKATNGLFIVVFAVLLIGTSVRRWRNWSPSKGRSQAVVAASALIGLVVALLVGHYGVV